MQSSYKMKKIAIYLVIFSWNIGSLSAQNDFRKGYIIKNNNDSIFGLIDYRGNKSNANKCIFKKNEKDNKQEYAPSEIKAYRFLDSKYYVTKTINVNGLSKAVFLEYLINGIVDIYYYRDDMDEHYLVDSGDGNLYPLKNELKEVYVNDQKYVRKSKEYLGVLKYVFNKCPEVAKEADFVQLDHKSLINIAHKYHERVCSGQECVVYEKRIPKIKMKFGTKIGIQTYNVKNEESIPIDYYYLRNSSFNNVVIPEMGVYFKFGMPNVNENLFFQYEGSYKFMKLQTNNLYHEIIYGLDYFNQISIKQHTLSNTWLFRYEFPKGMNRPVIQIGYYLNYFFKVDYNQELNIKVYNGETYKTQKFENYPCSRFDYGLNIGVGLIRKVIKERELSVNLYYQRGFNYLNFFSSNSIMLNLEFQLNH